MTEQMKPSGVAWIGEIPTDWSTKKIKYLASLKGRNGWQGLTSDEYTDEGPFLITGVDFSNGSIDWDSCVHISEKRWEEAPEIHISNGDLLITKDGTVGKVAIVEGLTDKASLNSGVLLIRTNTDFDRRFLFWVIQSEEFWYWFRLKNAGNSTIIHLYQGDFAEFCYTFPCHSEQKLIADYLDRRCAEIDSIIADIEKQIELLKQYKKSLITETVTKGLDKSVPMKDSGIKWIGEIPVSWEIKRLKYVMNNFDSQRKPIEAQNRSQEGEVLYDYYGASGAIDKIDDYIFNETSLLIGEDGANLVLRNLPLIYIAKGKYWVNNHAHILRPKPNNDLFYFAHQMEIIDYSNYITGSAQPKLSQENLNCVRLVVPPENEQRKISNLLNKQCEKIDAIISDKQQQLDTIQKHKKSLIYEYVTGKKRVKEAM